MSQPYDYDIRSVKRAALESEIWSHVTTDQKGYGDMIDLLMAYMNKKQLREVVIKLKRES